MYSDARWDNPFSLYPDHGGGAATTVSLLSMEEICWRTMLQQFDQLYALQEGWDGDDAEAPDADVLDSVVQLLNTLFDREFPPPNRIVPSLQGGVVIEWRSEKRYLEIEIEDPYCGEVMDVREGAVPEHYELCWNQPATRIRPLLENWPVFNEYALSDGFTTRDAANMG